MINDLPETMASELMRTAKFANLSLSWAERNNHKGLLIASFQVEDETGAYSAGVTVRLEIKKPIVVERCLYEFGLFKLHNGASRRAYQLNVTPFDKVSHNALLGPILGPHEHIGDAVYAVNEKGVQCGNLDVAFNFFCERINLQFTGAFNSPL
ncbi:hypothetical protein [Eoetvoesiella caeni]|nr:hypothetical protein [Eoetvoesiella caeni]MCI2809357.1 hypothetical protein [Eoetvoesiella caeni]NYT54498.1 hypothetical protein [Eoetvoesiella caeni]